MGIGTNRTIINGTIEWAISVDNSYLLTKFDSNSTLYVSFLKQQMLSSRGKRGSSATTFNLILTSFRNCRIAGTLTITLPVQGIASYLILKLPSPAPNLPTQQMLSSRGKDTLPVQKA